MEKELLEMLKLSIQNQELILSKLNQLEQRVTSMEVMLENQVSKNIKIIAEGHGNLAKNIKKLEGYIYSKLPLIEALQVNNYHEIQVINSEILQINNKVSG